MQFNRARARTITEDGLIPLINIVFLMLIFFMIAGQIRPPEVLNIEPPSSGQGQPIVPERILLLMDAEGRIALDGEILPLTALRERLATRIGGADVADASDGIARLGITLKADANVTQGQLRKLLEQLNALGIKRLQLLSQQSPN